MRDLKFRAWSKRENKMFNVDVLAISECGWGCPDYGKRGVSLAYQPGIVVMQYTGLKDKNGKEIYEGDVVLFDLGTTKSNPVEMKWGIAGFKYSSMLEMGHTCEIIGNIYENPELLNSEPEDQRSVARDDDSSTKAD